MKELKFLNLEQRRKIHRTVFLHKALLNISSQNLHYQISNYLPKFNTRNKSKNNLTIPTHNTAKFERSPLYKMILDWNSTPDTLPKDNVKLDKIHFQKYLINQLLTE